MQKKILIVDDTKSWLVFHKEVIQELYGDFFEIITANSATEALDIIRHNTGEAFCMVISDLQMESSYEPKLAGEWLVEQVKNIPAYSRTPIVLISAMYNIEHIAMNLGVECVSKTLLIHNKLLMKFMFEKLMPFLSNID